MFPDTLPGVKIVIFHLLSLQRAYSCGAVLLLFCV